MSELFSELFASGRIIDGILVLVALEAAALLAWRARTGRGPAPIPLLCNLASGASLMLALRAALTGAAWPIVAAWLVASLVAHLSELGLRLRADAQPAGAAEGRDGPPATKIVVFPGRRT